MPFRRCHSCSCRFISASGTADLCVRCRVSDSSIVENDGYDDKAPTQGIISTCIIHTKRDKVILDNTEKAQNEATDVTSEVFDALEGNVKSRHSKTVSKSSNVRTVNETRECSRSFTSTATHEPEKYSACAAEKSDFDVSIPQHCPEIFGTPTYEKGYTTTTTNSNCQVNDVLIESYNHASGQPCDKIGHDEKESQQQKLANNSLCIVCGTSLLHLNSVRSRVNHIKRCSKKHSVGVSDVIVNDYEDFVELNDKDKCNIDSPERKRTRKDINDNLLQDAIDPNKRKIFVANDQSPLKQSIMTSFFNRQTKSLNDVLLHGARCLAKSAEIIARNKEHKQRKFNSNKKGRKRLNNWGRKTNDKPTRSCPAYKKISATDIIVDGFYYANSALSKNYFLTHFHSDHYGGICSSWNSGIIYCSLITARLLNEQLGVDNKYLHPVKLNTPTVIESCGKPVTMTLLEANHCPGAVMVLFQVGSKYILHVGDFRWNNAIMMKMPELRQFNTLQNRLDELYLDTTYCDPKYNLPSQEDAIAAVISNIEEELTKYSRKKILILVGSYTIGKEKIYMSIAKQFGLKVYVDTRKLKILTALNWSPDKINILTTSRQESTCAVVPMGHLNFQKMFEYEKLFSSTKVFSSGYERVIAIRPTGWSLSKIGPKIVGKRTNGKFTIYSGKDT